MTLPNQGSKVLGAPRSDRRRAVTRRHEADNSTPGTRQTFTNVWRAAAAFDPSRPSFATWLYQVTRNRAVDLARRRRVRPQSAGDERLRAIPGGPEPEASVDGWDVARALSRIPEMHREVLTLAYFEGLSQREISLRTGVPLGTIKSRTTAALKRLHRSLVNPTAEEARRG